MLVRIKDLDYRVDFYWKKERYRQLIRVKNCKKSKVLCYKLYSPYEREDMPQGRYVKPVIKYRIKENV